ncbi:50S ribosomal protein L18 [Deinococcus peraridilitoris]|uniref:Large ribosomal subunit protein uL18 n=1 Tax=Deinococcus peraridilitoris (strain DSM 19664 / LMG 22246 / CIP 109416 / KR-200) TaxID=937777 RepID=L0A5P9_DEIPD|nr:50S ribosomal protein L18 [Deinococcus peraridilitoris]AFZ68502.1 ribosomal protein L18, bacterial type [Deinococcus peraridilitoris DSM 19664]
MSSIRRKLRNRSKVMTAAQGRPRLSVFRSSKYIYAQVIDDASGVTIAQAGGKALKSGSKSDTAAAVGKALAEAAAVKGVKQVVFDRGQYKFHGRVKALADAAREGGLDF